MMQVNQSYISLNKWFLYLLLVVFCSCTGDESFPDSEQQVNVKLTLELTRQTRLGTRSDVGIDELNENVIHSVDLFLYKKGDVAANEQPKFVETGIPVTSYNEATHAAQFSVSIPMDQFDALFPTDGDTECEVYIIVNRPTPTGEDNALPEDDQSVASLKENTILYSSTLSARSQDENGLYHPTLQESFVMDGMAIL